MFTRSPAASDAKCVSYTNIGLPSLDAEYLDIKKVSEMKLDVKKIFVKISGDG
jgi:hypothetical protein